MIGRRSTPGGQFHPLIPPLIELRCKCGGKITCEHPVNLNGYSDTPEGWFMRTAEDNEFNAKCNKCSFSKKGLTYFQLKEIGEPYFSASVGTEAIWGWNREHYQMVIDYLRGNDISGSRWQIYKQFISGKWKSKSRKNSYIKAAEKVLKAL